MERRTEYNGQNEKWSKINKYAKHKPLEFFTQKLNIVQHEPDKNKR
jgi:hypothetical protein